MLHYYIAPGLSYNHLQGALKKLNAEKLNKRIVIRSLDEAKAHRIMLVVAEYYNIFLQDLKSESRIGKFKGARQIAQYLIKEKTTLNYAQIARLFNRDRTTVYYSCQTVADLRSIDKKFDAEYKEVESYV